MVHDNKQSQNVAVILAGGTGSRLGSATPKQFFKVAGKMVIEHTIDAFNHHHLIDEIAVVIHPDYVNMMEEIVLRNQWQKLKKILKGGKERYQSSISAIKAYNHHPNTNLIFHDAVRPLINPQIIDEVVLALNKYNAVDVAVAATDTIIQVNDSGDEITSIPNRNFLRRGQTPQAFKLSVIENAYELALQDPDFVCTDDCGTVVKYLPNEPVYVVSGAESNMKLTYKEDTFLMDKLFQLRSTCAPLGVDFEKLRKKVLVVFGGNSGIGAELVRIAEQFGAKVFSFSRSTTSTDISDYKSVTSALESVASQTHNHIDYIVNSAAILSREPLITMDHDFIDTIIATNYNGMVNVAIASYPYLKESKGQLLLYTSSSYTRGRAFYSIYSSTKSAVVNFMQAIAQEWDQDEIRVNVINPERTKTPMRVKNFGIEPDNTLLKANDVARASLCTLLSDFTGQVVDVKIKNNDA
ncbi:MAG: bifunctional cytidylyltransferase/SDR family oxidoreductase [Bacteroidales bacterium]|nr:bifunctional cytidylyltransferase/SDR family oxidoreductase [Bacteroidales bacterium]